MIVLQHLNRKDGDKHKAQKHLHADSGLFGLEEVFDLLAVLFFPVGLTALFVVLSLSLVMIRLLVCSSDWGVV